MSRAPYQVLIFPYRQTGDGEFEYALFQRTEEGYWQAVAGGGEEDESPLEAARRETMEEAGISSRAAYLPLQSVASVPVTEFRDRHLWREETYVIPEYCFGVLVSAEEIKISHEHRQFGWFSYAEAYDKLDYESNRVALWELNCRLLGTAPRDEIHPASLEPKTQTTVFLKLGGSLITDKTRPHTARLEVLNRLAGEIATALSESPDIRLVLGHGSGSFGHVPAKKYGTRNGVHSEAEWRGFNEVWYEARSLNHMVIEALHAAGLPAIAFSASAATVTRNGQIIEWGLSALKAALEHNQIPVVYGDVAFDAVLGGTILSTEDIFDYLALRLRPERLLLAGLEEGVYEDYPLCTRLLPVISTLTFPKMKLNLGGSSGTDVTGGMASKVRQTLALVEKLPELNAWIFSGAIPGNVRLALLGKGVGTHLTV